LDKGTVFLFALPRGVIYFPRQHKKDNTFYLCGKKMTELTDAPVFSDAAEEKPAIMRKIQAAEDVELKTRTFSLGNLGLAVEMVRSYYELQDVLMSTASQVDFFENLGKDTKGLAKVDAKQLQKDSKEAKKTLETILKESLSKMHENLPAIRHFFVQYLMMFSIMREKHDSFSEDDENREFLKVLYEKFKSEVFAGVDTTLDENANGQNWGRIMTMKARGSKDSINVLSLKKLLKTKPQEVAVDFFVDCFQRCIIMQLVLEEIMKTVNIMISMDFKKLGFARPSELDAFLAALEVAFEPIRAQPRKPLNFDIADSPGFDALAAYVEHIINGSLDQHAETINAFKKQEAVRVNEQIRQRNAKKEEVYLLFKDRQAKEKKERETDTEAVVVLARPSTAETDDVYPVKELPEVEEEPPTYEKEITWQEVVLSAQCHPDLSLTDHLEKNIINVYSSISGVGLEEATRQMRKLKADAAEAQTKRKQQAANSK
jgi:hypothetical protein